MPPTSRSKSASWQRCEHHFVFNLRGQTIFFALKKRTAIVKSVFHLQENRELYAAAAAAATVPKSVHQISVCDYLKF